MNKYNIVITLTEYYDVSVNANDEDDAIEKVKDQFSKGEIVDYRDVEFEYEVQKLEGKDD